MILYYTPNTCSLASHIALEQAGADYEIRLVDFANSDQKSGKYLRLNPKSRVPTLVTSRGNLTETPAILAFISQMYPQADLAPLDDPFKFAQIQAFNTYLCATLHVAHAHKFRGYRWVDENDTVALEAMKKKAPESVGDCFELIQANMFQGPWVMGETYSISDIYLYTVSRWIEMDGVDPARFPKIIEHRDRVAQLPAVQKVHAVERGEKIGS